jgi:hypothetical protein
LFDGHEVNVEGTVYIPQEFKKGYLKFSNERKMTIPQVRFNSYDNRIEFKEGKEEKVLTLPIVEFGFEEAAGSMRVFKKDFLLLTVRLMVLFMKWRMMENSNY